MRIVDPVCGRVRTLHFDKSDHFDPDMLSLYVDCVKYEVSDIGAITLDYRLATTEDFLQDTRKTFEKVAHERFTTAIEIGAFHDMQRLVTEALRREESAKSSALSWQYEAQKQKHRADKYQNAFYRLKYLLRPHWIKNFTTLTTGSERETALGTKRWGFPK